LNYFFFRELIFLQGYSGATMQAVQTNETHTNISKCSVYQQLLYCSDYIIRDAVRII